MKERYKEEIEEILRRVGDSPEANAPRRAQKPQGVTRKIPGIQHLAALLKHFVSPGKVLLLGLALLLSALLVRGSAPDMVGFLGWGGLVTLILAYVLFFAHPRPSYEKRWRGTRVNSTHSGWWERLRRWFRR